MKAKFFQRRLTSLFTRSGLNREWRAYRAAKRMDWVTEDRDEQG